MNLAPTPAPLHDIVGPIPATGWPLGLALAVAAGVVVAGLVLLALFRPQRKSPPISPRQRALAALAALRARELEPYDFGVQASDILREFVRDEHGLDATTRTSLEFLEALQNHPIFDLDERAALAGFLEAADLLKFARAGAAQQDMQRMLETAERLVRGRSAAP